jgi:basic membrane lipoprotein Med (substrate-binding protein (PBP1-ABC) superfamily)
MCENAEKGYQLITGDAFGAERMARRVARDYPDVAFVFGSGIGPAEPNFGVFNSWIHEPAYLSGTIAGKMTKSNGIGVVEAAAEKGALAIWHLNFRRLKLQRAVYRK